MGAALMHTGYYFGFFLAALANYFIGSRFGWRYMFVVGGAPALLVAFSYNRLKEPARWEKKQRRAGAEMDAAQILSWRFSLGNTGGARF